MRRPRARDDGRQTRPLFPAAAEEASAPSTSDDTHAALPAAAHATAVRVPSPAPVTVVGAVVASADVHGFEAALVEGDGADVLAGTRAAGDGDSRRAVVATARASVPAAAQRADAFVRSAMRDADPVPVAASVDVPQRWACCTLPALSLEVFDACDGARVVIDGPAQRAFVHAANPAALAAGIRIGQTLAAARACCAGLDVQRRDVAAEAMRLQTLALRAYGSSSQVLLDPPDALLLEVGASLRLFGGWPAIRQRLRDAFVAEGHAPWIALAPTPLAARLLAPLRDGTAVADRERLAHRLARVPIDVSRLPARAQAMLVAIGVRTLGEARRLPAPALARRAGRELTDHLDRLYGDVPDPRPLWQPPRRFELRCEFEYGIETSPALRFPLQRLTREFARHLHARDAAVLRFELRFGHEGEAPTSMAVGLRTALRSAEALFDAARNRLEQHALAAPAHWLELVADDLPPFLPAGGDLFDPAARGALDWDALVERLRARLGDDAVDAVSPWPDHRPERAWRRGEHRIAEADVASAPRPAWLLPTPQPLRARILRFVGAPERIESGWWDGADARRDYYVADLDSGQRAWLFREAGRDDGEWMLHGWFG